MSIRIAANLIKETQRQERARFRRALNREEKYLRSLINSPIAGCIMRGDLEGAFGRIRKSVKPKR